MNVGQYRLQFTVVFFLYQQTALHVAAREGYVHTVRYLLKHADKSIKDNDGVSIWQLHY